MFQRDHEDLLREAEQQQERNRKTIDELSASVTTLTGKLREQEEALTSSKVNTLRASPAGQHSRGQGRPSVTSTMGVNS